MPIIQRPDLVEKVRKRYEITGPDAVATLSPELVPVVIVDDAAARDEDQYRRAIGFHQATAAAGQYAQINLYLPNTANNADKLIRIRRMWFAVDNATFITLRIMNGDLGTAGTYYLSDTRLRPQTSPLGRVTYRSNAVITGTEIHRIYANAGNLLFDVDLWLAPGYGYGFSNNSAQRWLSAYFDWEEHTL